MFLMILALVSSQAGASVSDEVGANAAAEQARYPDDGPRLLSTTVTAHMTGDLLTVSIDAAAEFGILRFVFE